MRPRLRDLMIAVALAAVGLTATIRGGRAALSLIHDAPLPFAVGLVALASASALWLGSITLLSARRRGPRGGRVPDQPASSAAARSRATSTTRPGSRGDS